MTNVKPVSPTNPHIERVCGVEDGASEDEHENESDQKVADDEVEEKETEEALRIRVQRRILQAPIAEEIRLHEQTHLPYRSWCPICVAARGVSQAHRRKREEEERLMPTIAYDYCFMRNRAGEEYAPVLVSKDQRTGMINAHVVPRKGVDVDGTFWANHFEVGSGASFGGSQYPNREGT